MSRQWGDSQPPVLEQSGTAGTVVLVLILVAIVWTLAGVL